MANYTAADVKALRERTGAGMLDCKKALDESNGDLDKAVEYIRVKGLKGVAKREGRSTSEGLVAAREGDGKVVLIELDSETDFVAKNAKFGDLAKAVVDAVFDADAETLEAALAAPTQGKTVGEIITDASAMLGEHVVLRRVALLKGEKFSIYLHKTSPDLPPQVGVALAYTGDDADTARAVAQHISFADPQYLTEADIPEADLANERRIAEETAREEGKPEKALPKIIEGRVHGFVKQVALVEQPYARDSKQSVGQVLKDSGLTVTDFARFRVGA